MKEITKKRQPLRTIISLMLSLVMLAGVLAEPVQAAVLRRDSRRTLRSWSQ